MKFLFLFIVILSSFSVSASHSCVGKVENLAIDSGSNVHAFISTIGAGHTYCSLKAVSGDWDPEGCRAVLSTLMTAKVSGKDVRIYFNNDSNTTCDKGTWQNLTTAQHGFYYIQLEN